MDNIPMTDTKDLILEINKATDLIKKQAEITHTEIKNIGKITDETKLNTDKLFSELNGYNARLTELEQKSQRLIQHSANPQDLGSSITSSPEFKSIQERGSAWHGTQQFIFDQKAITSQSATGVATATALVTPYHVPGIIAPPNRPLLIRDLLMPGRTNSSSIWYGEESLFENNADFVAENPSTSKPEAKLEFTGKIANVTHLARASNQILADSPALQSYINERLVYGLNFKEDEALLHGDGSGITIKGLMPSSTPYQKPRGVNITSETFIDRLRLAMLQASLAGYPPTAHILSPVDWANIVLTKDSMNQYIFADATGSTGKMLWGLPVIETLSMTAGKFLTGAFRFAAQIYDRDEITVTLATQNPDDFEKNMVTILAEKRLALCIYCPQALVNGSFSDEETQETTKTK